jgi:hypothetical protein
MPFFAEVLLQTHHICDTGWRVKKWVQRRKLINVSLYGVSALGGLLEMDGAEESFELIS